jgi:hypothetical protein
MIRMSYHYAPQGLAATKVFLRATRVHLGTASLGLADLMSKIQWLDGDSWGDFSPPPLSKR